MVYTNRLGPMQLCVFLVLSKVQMGGQGVKHQEIGAIRKNKQITIKIIAKGHLWGEISARVEGAKPRLWTVNVFGSR